MIDLIPGFRGRKIGIGAVAGIMMLLVSGSAIASKITADEQSPVFTDIPGQIRALRETPSSGKIDGTYSATHLFDTYSAGVQHV